MPQTETQGKSRIAEPVNPDTCNTHATEFFKTLRKGDFLFDVSQNIEKLTESIRQHRKGGKVVIEIAIEPQDKSAHMVTVTDKITLKLPPEPCSDPTIFFTTGKNTLSRRDPRQMEIDLDGTKDA
jgi:hypothetical protein